MAIEFDTRYYRGVLVRVQDANNLRVNILAVGNCWLHNQKLRLHGVIMPNWRSKDPDVKLAGDLCVKEIKKHIAQGREYIFKIYGRDKMYCEVFVDGMNLNEYLLENGFAMNHLIKNID